MVNGSLTMFVRSRETVVGLRGRHGEPLHPWPASRFADASDLIERYGDDAGFEAAAPRRAQPRRRQCRALLPLAADRAGDRDAEQRRGARAPSTKPLRGLLPEERTGAVQERWLRLRSDEWVGFKGLGRAAAVRGRRSASSCSSALARRPAAVRTAATAAAADPTRPSSIPTRRSRRCPTSASRGPSSTPKRHAPRGSATTPTSRQEPCQKSGKRAADRRGREHPLHGAGRRPWRHRRCRGPACAISASNRPLKPSARIRPTQRRSAAARAPTPTS